MQPASTDTTTSSIRDSFLLDHLRLEHQCHALIEAFEGGDREKIGKLWSELEGSLLSHLETEEAFLIPSLMRVNAHEAQMLLDEHKHFRIRLIELGVGLDLKLGRLESAREFIRELQTHAATEDRLLYHWSDDALDAGFTFPAKTAVATYPRMAFQKVDP